MQPQPGTDPLVARRRAQVFSYASIFSGFPERAKQAAFRGQLVNVPYSDLTAQARNLVKQLVYGRGTHVQDHPEASFNGTRDYEQVVVEVRPRGTVDKPGLWMWLRCGNSNSGPSFPDIVNVPGWHPKEGWDWSGEYLKKYMSRQRRPAQIAGDPQLQKKISLSGHPDQTIEKVLSELSDRAELPLIGEYDPCFRSSQRGSRIYLESEEVKDLPIWQALDVIAKRFDLNWDIRDGWIWIRSPRTALSRSGELDLSPPSLSQSSSPPK